MTSVIQNQRSKRQSNQRMGQAEPSPAVEAIPISYVSHPEFDCHEFAHNVLETLPRVPLMQSPAGEMRLEGAEYRLPNRPLLDAQSEKALFLRMNLLRHMAARRQRRLATDADPVTSARIMRNLLHDADDARNEIIEANQRLVISNAAKFARSGLPLADLISEGNLALVKAIEGFDVCRGYRLSTYATYAIRRHLSRYVQREQKRAPVLSDELLEPTIEDHTAEWIDQHPGELVKDILGALPQRERTMVRMRFGLTEDGKSHTLDAIGRRFGISKERVRQLIVRSCAEAFEAHAGKLGIERVA